MPPISSFHNWILGLVGAIAVTGILGSLKLYSDIQVHFNMPMHAGADRRFDSLEKRILSVENEGRTNDAYLDTMVQILAQRTRIVLPKRKSD